MKSFIRCLLWAFAVVTGGAWYGKPGTLKFRFGSWILRRRIEARLRRLGVSR